MYILGVVGSPRKGGNTDVLVAEALRGAAGAGSATEKITLVDFRVNPCQACAGCHRTGVCRQDDDMAGLLEKLFASDAWILGTPVYWWGPSAQLKAFVDRWYAPIHSAERKAKMRKRVALVAPFGDSDPDTARHLVGMLADALSYLEADFAGKLLVTASGRGEVAGNARAMRDAFDLGVRLATGSTG